MKYLNIHNAIDIHSEIIEVSGGRDGYNKISIGYLDSALEQIKNDDFYPSMAEKITHLMFSCIKSHPFIDGNKRSSIYLAMHFLDLNDYSVENFPQEMEDIVVEIAENTLSKSDLLKIIKSFLSLHSE